MQVVDRHGVALGGFMGTGKSTVGRIVADRLGLPFVDLDAELTRRFGPIPAQFAAHGEATFRAREADLVAEVCAGPAAVVATGGGAWVSAANRDRLRRWGRLVVLTAPIDELRRRIGADPGRPLLAQMDALYAARAAAYADAELVVDTAGRDPASIAEEVATWSSR